MVFIITIFILHFHFICDLNYSLHYTLMDKQIIKHCKGKGTEGFLLVVY
jgi:hypothetical protein